MKKPIPASIGIDVSKAKLDVALIFTDKSSFCKTFSNDERSIGKLISYLKENGADISHPVVVESTGDYHILSCLMLDASGLRVHCINPLITKKYQKSSIRGAKTDPIDAKRLAEIGLIEEKLPIFSETIESIGRKKIIALLAKLQTLKQQLNRSYKQFLETQETLGFSLDISSVGECVEKINQTIENLKKMIVKDPTPAMKELAKIRGISLLQSAILLTSLAGKTFTNRDQLVAFFGLDVRARQSGKWQGKQKLSKRGNAFYRKVLFQLGWSLKTNNDDYKAYYEKLYRQDGKHFFTAILATARKFLRFLFSFLYGRLSS